MSRFLSLTPLSLLLLLTPAPAQTQFRDARNWVAPDHKKVIYNCRSGDVDGDGRVDLIYVCDYSGIVLYMNDGQGGFKDETTLRLPPATNYASYDAVAKDMDGDGDLDLVVANDHIYANRILINNGSGRFTDQSASRFPSNGHWTTGLEVFDADRDGDQDIYFYNHGQTDHLFLNNGKGVFSNAPAGSVPMTVGAYKGALEAGDLDGDGDLDLLIEGNPLQILENNGKAVFTHSKTITFPATVTSAPTIRDFDRNGLPDVFFASDYRLFLSLGKGAFQDATQTHLPANIRFGHGLVADVDMDGDLDLAGSYLLFLNDGNARFSNVSAQRFPAGARLGVYSLIDDLDADGDPDIYCPTWKRFLVNHDTQLATSATPSVGNKFRLEMYSKPGYGKTQRVALPLLGFNEAQIPLGAFGVLRIRPSALFLLPGQLIPTTSGKASLELAIPAQASWKGIDLFFQAATFTPPGQVRLGNLIRERIQ